MAEDRNFLQPSSNAAQGDLERLAAATGRIESLLVQTLADYEALRLEHQKLNMDYHALKARTQSVSDGMDETISRLKKWMSADGVAAGEGGLWAK